MSYKGFDGDWLARHQAKATKGGTVAAIEPVKPKKPRMNKWETEYAQMLEFQKRGGAIQWWQFEPMKLWLGEGAWFTPDFGVIGADGLLCFHEVKGFWREAAKVRIKVARSMYPFPFLTFRKFEGWWVEDKT
jgi:hypothetical protein